MAKYHQGLFKPKHPEKYAGDPKNIVYRSSWELKMMMWLDNHPSVVRYASEEFHIPYRDPTSGRVRRYFPDFIVEFKNKTVVIEIKPLKQCSPSTSKNKRTYMKEQVEYVRNNAKWEAAKLFCAERNWAFQVVTEKELFGK